MVEVAVIVTLGTVLILLALTVVTRWIVPKVLAEEDHDDHGESDELETTAEGTSQSPPSA